MLIRRYKSSDCEKIAKLFYNTVHAVNINDYTSDEVNAWATGVVDLEKWDKSFCSHYTLVAIEDEIIVGFGDIDKTGYIDRLYIHKNYQNRGIATAICDELEQAVQVDKIITQASVTAKTFFELRGYTVIKKQQVIREEVSLTNYVMHKEMKSSYISNTIHKHLF